MEKILWGTKVGEPEWAEVLISENPDSLDDAKAWATANGFDRLRVADFDPREAPDFTKVF